jgi:hypothetical protein
MAKRSDLFWAIVTVAVAIVVIVIAGWLLLAGNFSITSDESVSTVAGNVPADWNTITNNQYGFTMSYPNGFFDPGHQPRVLVGDCNYSVFPNQCPDLRGVVSGDSDAGGNYQNAAISKITINNNQYCVNDVQDAATGHVFHNYYYSTVRNQKCLVVYFETSSTNCDFYLPLQAGNAEQQTNYNNCVTKNQNQPTTLNQIINTFNFQ